MSALAVAARQPAKALEVAASRREDSLADLTARWLRIVHWWMRQHIDQADRLLRFADELQQLRGMALANTGLNRAMQLERLFLTWAELWRETGFPPRV